MEHVRENDVSFFVWWCHCLFYSCVFEEKKEIDDLHEFYLTEYNTAIILPTIAINNDIKQKVLFLTRCRTYSTFGLYKNGFCR